MKARLLALTRHAYSSKQRTLALLVLAPIFLLFLPWALIWLGARLDKGLGWSAFLSFPFTLILGALLIVPGLLLGFWSNYAQFTLGQGTPVPLMATQKLVVQPPYTYCRNPMALGAICTYLGVAVLFGSPGAVLLVLPGAGVLLTYIKWVEEKEMELRFGPAYLEYRRHTPFLLPRFWR